VDILGYLTPLSKVEGKTEYEKGRQYAHKSMITIYKLIGKYVERTRQYIYFFTYTNKMSEILCKKDDDYSIGQADAFKEIFEHFKPRRK
jgi:hypothetical protein